MSGVFITFEGSDGAGKTIQSQLLYDYLTNQSIDVVLTREPGGTKISEQIRAIILDNNNDEMFDMTEALLYAAARAQHVEEVIKPNLSKGKIVICDRFVDSSVAYQGAGRGLGLDLIENINNYATLGLKPDLTFFLDLKPSEGIKRKKAERELDRLESEMAKFHQKVYNAYGVIVKENHKRIVVIDASDTIEHVHEMIITKLDGYIKITS